jgi:hypothetical protein
MMAYKLHRVYGTKIPVSSPSGSISMALFKHLMEYYLISLQSVPFLRRKCWWIAFTNIPQE